jgi:hypothetical protein
MATPEGSCLMTHDELLAKLLISNETKLYDTLTQWQKVLYAVVELHRPEEQDHKQYKKCWNCNLVYPCPTIQAFWEELS